MVRKGAPHPRVGDWVALAAIAVVALVLQLSGASFRYHMAGFLRTTIFLPTRLVTSYAVGPSDTGRELTRLRRDLARNALDEAALLEARFENERLRQQLGFLSLQVNELVPCQVVGVGSDRFGEVLTLSRGWADGAYDGQSVVGPGGLIGVVTGTEAHQCWAKTLRHGGLPLSGLLSETRYVGMLRWSPRHRLLRFEGIPLHSDVKDGMAVVTSGHGRIFPKGIPIGSVVRVADDSTGLVKEIYVRPAVDLERLEEVFLLAPGGQLIVPSPPEPAPIDSAASAPAADTTGAPAERRAADEPAPAAVRAPANRAPERGVEPAPADSEDDSTRR
jgi:rod shape-determining protein MreC